MTVEVLHYTPIEILDSALTKCWASDCKTGDAMMERIDRIINKNKHGSIAEHCTVNFDIRGVSRALLQEVARHRMANISVKSSRYTLKELRDEDDVTNAYPEEMIDINEYKKEVLNKFIVLTGDDFIDGLSAQSLAWLQYALKKGIPNDKAKYCMPEAYKTDFTWTLNIRSLMNLFELRTDKSALWEFRQLANEMFNVLPEPYKYLLKGYVKNEL